MRLTTNPDHCASSMPKRPSTGTDVWYWKTPTEECLDGRTDVTCVAWTGWVEAWNDAEVLTV